MYRVLFVVGALALELVTANPASSVETCKASWYGAEFQGKKMANGKRFNMNDPTIIAHKDLEFGTRVRIRNLDNGRILIGRISDRGPYETGRCVDVSRAGAARLGMIHSGTARVSVTVLN